MVTQYEEIKPGVFEVGATTYAIERDSAIGGYKITTHINVGYGHFTDKVSFVSDTLLKILIDVKDKDKEPGYPKLNCPNCGGVKTATLCGYDYVYPEQRNGFIGSISQVYDYCCEKCSHKFKTDLSKREIP